MQPLVVEPGLSVPLRFLAGVVGGVVATLAMDVVMARLPEGTTPPAIASGVLTDRPPDDAPDRLATVVHYLAGSLTGPLFIWLLFAVVAVAGRSGVAVTLGATAVLYALMVGFFAVVVLPRSLVAADRVATIRRDWAVSAAAYLVVLVPFVTVVSGVL